MATCYPDPNDWEDLRVDLTDGERHLAEHLTQALPEEWRLYLQPHVGGTRPDLVLVHPRAGVQIIEVKDYDLGAYALSDSDWQVRTGDGLQSTRSPFEQVDAARRALFRILLPFAEEARQEDRSLYGFVRAGVYFHSASPGELETVRSFAHRSLGPDARFYGLANRMTLAENDESALVPLLAYEETGSPHVATIEKRADEIGLTTSWVEMLHGWLHPTPDEVLQNEPLRLTASQQKAARNEARRLLVTGPAGSGKTLVLARRAARVLLRGEDVLLLGFNITLWHYVRDFVARGVRAVLREEGDRNVQTRYTAAMRRLRVTHYHDLAFRIFDAIGGDAEETHPEEVARLLAQHADTVTALVESDETAFPKVDALLVDEGQDWGPNWLASLRPLLREEASITVAADPEQRIYEHAVEDPRALFQKAPVTTRLNGTARVPAALLPALNVAANRWLGDVGGDLEKARQVSMDFSDRPNPEALWTTAQNRRRDCVMATVRKHLLEGVNPSQMAVLVPTHDEGLALEPRFEAAGIDTCSLCTTDPDRDRSGKHAFWRLDPRLKLSTVHSFKGWEADVVVVLLTGVPPSDTERELLHVALTRTRAVVHVVAPPGAEDLPAWTHRTGRALLDEVPVPAAGPPSTDDLAGPSPIAASGRSDGLFTERAEEVPLPQAPHPADRMD